MVAINALAIIPSLLRGNLVEETGTLTTIDLSDDAISPLRALGFIEI
jgi:hypothetical protein